MPNPTLHYPGDEPTPCWTCSNFVGLFTRSGERVVWVTCEVRGRWTPADPDHGCRYWSEQPKPPAPEQHVSQTRA